MTKEEKISEAYGEYWNKYQNHIDDIDGSLEDLYIGQDSQISVWVLSNCERINQDGNGNFSWRPISLRGIENNNGWVKLESAGDLPLNTTKCHVVDFEGNIGETSLYANKRFLEQYSHYQVIVIAKPHPPLF